MKIPGQDLSSGPHPHCGAGTPIAHINSWLLPTFAGIQQTGPHSSHPDLGLWMRMLQKVRAWERVCETSWLGPDSLALVVCL